MNDWKKISARTSRVAANVEENSERESSRQHLADEKSKRRHRASLAPKKSRLASWFGGVSLFFLLVSLGTLLGSFLLNDADFKTSEPVLASNVASDVSNAEPQATKYVTKNIEEIRIGERTLGTNPQGAESSESDATIFDNVKHYGYSLCYRKKNGTQCNISLLRPEDWLDYEIVQLRRKSDGKILDEIDVQLMEMEPNVDVADCAVDVWLELPEMGVIGWATLIEIDDAVRVQPGQGNVVTGTFAHNSDEVIDLQIEGQTKPIGCTANHPFWSVDRQDFVEAGQLQEGERVQLYSGETKRVVQKLPRPGPQNVYNLEVYSEHVYHVTSNGVLVHNNCHSIKLYHGTSQDSAKNIILNHLDSTKFDPTDSIVGFYMTDDIGDAISYANKNGEIGTILEIKVPYALFDKLKGKSFGNKSEYIVPPELVDEFNQAITNGDVIIRRYLQRR